MNGLVGNRQKGKNELIKFEMITVNLIMSFLLCLNMIRANETYHSRLS